jgi:FAS-associated factor 2
VRKQAKIGMVVLVCGEHEDDEEFKRDVVCDPELVRFIKEKEIMVWGADIRSREGYQGMSTITIQVWLQADDQPRRLCLRPPTPA